MTIRAALLRTLPWLAPGGLVVAGALALGAFANPGSVEEAVRPYPGVAFVAAFLLASLFHRSRVAIATLAVGVAWILLTSLRGGPVLPVLLGPLLVLLLGGLAPSRDRGLLSPTGLMQAAVAGGLWGGLVLAIHRAGSQAQVLVEGHVLPLGVSAWSGLPEAGLALTLVGGASLAYGAFRWRGPVERGLLWSSVAILVGLHPWAPAAPALYLLAAALALALSVVETGYALAYRDDLTSLPGRRALLRDMEGLAGTFTLAMLDVDHFKKFNDRHGHDVGDQVLRMVALRMSRVSGGGKAYRYGGEEFTIVFPRGTRDDAAPHLESVRHAIEEARFTLRSWGRPRKKPGKPSSRKRRPARSLSVTVSIGMADSTGKDGRPEGVLETADKALYRAKRAGRNRVSR